MMANELFYYTGAAFFILLILIAIVITVWLIVFLVSLQKAVKSFRRLIEEAGTGIKIKFLEMLLKFLGR